MGLLSKVKAAAGLVKKTVVGKTAPLRNKLGQVGMVKSTVAVVKKAAQVAAPIAKKAVSVGKFAAGIVSPVKKIALGVAGATLAYKGVKAVAKKVTSSRAAKKAASLPTSTQHPMASAASGGAAVASSGGGGAAVMDWVKEHPILATAGVAGAAYGAEQIAEALGVRGGAGFIGKRKTKKRKSSKKRKTTRKKSKTRKKGKRVSFTTKDGRRVSFTPGKGRRKRSRSRISNTESKRIMALIRRSAR